jgi:hypothetical protein
MTIHKVLQMHCTSCNRGLIHCDQISFEDEEELFECAAAEKWATQIKVQNGSNWDFCPKCYKAHLEK